MKIYLSGPMTGYPQYNFPAFDYAAAKLRAEGHEVFSPADNDRVRGLTGDTTIPFPPGVTARVLFKDDTSYICDHAEKVALLAGWEKSRGARAEVALAEAIQIQVEILGPEYNLPTPANDNAPAPARDKVAPPSRALPQTSAARKEFPLATGVIDYFPDALAAVSNVSFIGNKQHNPGQDLHWARGKSMDHADTIVRHFVERGTVDVDGVRHSAKLAWRTLALLQQELEAELNLPLPRGARAA